MGTFRVILALCVVLAHASPLPGIRALEPQLAVRAFFVISGFYMAFILTEKYPATPEGRRLFYTNRLLRIYPMYLITLIGAVLLYVAASVSRGHAVDRLQLWDQAWRRGSGGALALIGVSQLTVVGLDVTPLLEFSPSAGFRALAGIPTGDAGYAWRFNFLPHCWSIGVELFFYALAPWLVRMRLGFQVLLCLAGLMVNAWISQAGGHLGSAAGYHLGILQVPFFLLGILSCTALRRTSIFRLRPGGAAAAAALLTAVTFSGWPSFVKPSGWLYVLGVSLLIPVLFHVSRSWSWDRWVGELSYPIYLLHVPVKWLLLAARGVEARDTAQVSGAALAGATLVAALLMVVLVDRPLERFRRARFERGIAPRSAGP
jgi:peptidoglycan/LPS O-acetylase OafA/YrhL